MGRRGSGFWRRFAVILLKSGLLVLTKREWRGSEHVPASGGVIFVANHISHFDPPVLAHFIYDAGRWPRFLAKSGLFSNPVLGAFFRGCDQIPVYRGSSDAARALADAVAAVDAGHGVMVYPEGTTTRDLDLWPMRGKTGVARLVVATGAPVIPITMWGPQRVFDPRVKRLRLRPRTPVTVVAGPPVDLSRWIDQIPAGEVPTAAVLQDMTDAIMARLRDALAEIRGESPPETPDRGGAADRKARP